MDAELDESYGRSLGEMTGGVVVVDVDDHVFDDLASEVLGRARVHRSDDVWDEV